MENKTEVTQFFLQGLASDPGLQLPLFIIFLLIYTITLVGNLGMILLIVLDAHLHSPMYIFLGNLSLVDFCYSSGVTPKVMAGFLVGDKVMSYNDCAAQMFFVTGFATVENYLLASMAYDRYAAVCKPLHYASTMTTSMCIWMIAGCYACGFLNACIYTGDAFSLSFCKADVVHHFFCDIPAVMVLSCSNKHINELVLVCVASFNIFFCSHNHLNILPNDFYHNYKDALSFRTSKGHVHLCFSFHCCFYFLWDSNFHVLAA
jgi:olfactory receptor